MTRMAVMAFLVLVAPRVGADEPSREVPTPEALEAIELLESRDAYGRQRGFLLLEALREEATVPTILRHVDSAEPTTRAYSLRALAAIQGVRAVPRLLQALDGDRDERVRRAALLALEPLQPQDPAILPALIAALRDRKTTVRMTAVDIVSRIDDPQAREAILGRHKRERRRDVRRVLEPAMHRVGQP